MEALGNPSASLINAYVAVAQSPGISLDALMALLCACPLLVCVPVDARPLYMPLRRVSFDVFHGISHATRADDVGVECLAPISPYALRRII